jgi:hypothetical protein
MSTHSYLECIAQDHPCFACKMRYWREDGIPGLALPDHERWNGPTLRERIEDTITRSRANGYEPEFVGRAHF